MIPFSSGTTGDPKAVNIHHGAFVKQSYYFSCASDMWVLVKLLLQAVNAQTIKIKTFIKNVNSKYYSKKIYY